MIRINKARPPMLHLSELRCGRHLLMSIKSVLLGVTSSARIPVGTRLTALECGLQ